MLSNRRNSQIAAGLVTLGIVSAVSSRPDGVPDDPPNVAAARDDRLTLAPEHSELRFDPTGSQRLILTIRNAGSTPARIQGVTPHCGCTVAQLPDDPIVAAGGTNAITLTASPPDIGEKRTTVDIWFDSPRTPVLTASLLLKGDPLRVPYFVSVPDSLIIAGSPRGATGTLEVRTIEQRRASPLIEAAESDNGDVTAVLKGMMETEGASAESVGRRYTFAVTARPSSTGAKQVARIVLTTTAALQTPPRSTHIVAEFAAAVRAIPEKVSLYAASSAELPKEATVRVMAKDSADDLTIELVGESPAWLAVSGPDRLAGGSAFVAIVRLKLLAPPDNGNPSGPKTVVRLSTNCPECPIIEIPVYARVGP